MWVSALVDATAVSVQPQWSWTTTVSLFQTVMQLLLGAGGLYGLFKGVALLWKMSNETKKLDADGSAVVRKEMADMNHRQNSRIEKLEEDVRQERKRCDDEARVMRDAHAAELASMRLAHAEEMREMRKQIEGLHSQMVQMQRSTGAVIRTVGAAPTTTARMDAEGIGEALRETFKLPDTDLTE